ncbi:hypothetical protein U9M48_043016 [Paspalum notatum var. saurae]|uniref:Uncharacterized protein n=1 Tax=Paspalum notatum var. saurae TaxID=547442 RepID=A0AAQ3USK7_PASNO
MALVTAEVTWLRWLLEDFGVSVSIPTPLLTDSTGAISIARDPVKHEITKHIGVDAYYTRAYFSWLHIAVDAHYTRAYFSWLISSRRHRPELNIAFISPNSGDENMPNTHMTKAQAKKKSQTQSELKPNLFSSPVRTAGPSLRKTDAQATYGLHLERSTIAHDPVKHEVTKHIGVDAYYTRAQV